MNRFVVVVAALAAAAFAIVANADTAVASPAVVAPAAAPAAASASASASAAEALLVGVHTYAIDARKSLLAVQVFKSGPAAGLAHDHVIHASTLSGSITVDAANRATAKVNVSLLTSSLVNDDPKIRKLYGVTSDISDSDKAAVLEHMQDDGQLDIANYPTMSFVSTSATPGEGNKLTLNGKLTMHGVTKDVSLPIDAVLKGNTIDGKGSVKLNTSDFGIKPYSAFLGAVKNKDGIVLHVHLVATTKT